VIFAFYSCKQTQKKEKGFTMPDSTHYDNFILNIALATPEFASEKYFNMKHLKAFEFAKELILRKKEIKDTASGILLRKHDWTYDGGQSFSKTIVFVSNGKDFEYAFPFLDEFYYHLEHSKKNSDLYSDYVFNQHKNFEFQLNYIVHKLDLNKSSRRNKLNRFITLLADSLLGMKEIEAAEVDSLKKQLNHITNQNYNENPCSDSASKTINAIIADLQNITNRSIRYFQCKEGNYGYWRLQLIPNDSCIFIKPEFKNKECYSVLFW